MTEHSKRFPKTHDLVALARLLESAVPELAALDEDLDLLTRFAVAYRYPGQSSGKKEAESAIKAMRKARRFLREAVGG